MEWNDVGVDGQHTVKFTDLPYVPLTSSPQSLDADELFVGRKQGGIVRHGEWAWLARNSVLQIVSLRNGQNISSYEFCESRGYESCCIKGVEEIYPNNPEIMLLAVVLESFHGPGGGCSYVAVYSVELSSVLSTIELSLHLTCARFMDESACRRSLLQNFDGCLAVGSEEGAVVLLDMNIRKLMSMRNELNEHTFVPCHIVDYSLPLTEIHRKFRQCQQDAVHFGLQMEVIESPCSIQSILPINLILGLAIGLEDGRLALYDLAELQIFYIALPNPEVTMSAVVKMDFLEPPDDPRPCLFVWALHENGENLHAVLHSLMYEKRLIGENESSTYFETFQASSVRLQLPLEATKSVALSCQAVSTLSTHGEDDSNCLCAISWLSVLEGKNKLLIFDLNQWYKEEMPYVLEYDRQPNYLAGYILNGECIGLHTLLNSNNIAHFNSMQRFEEHFYPNSLSFEILLLHTKGSRHYNWEGVQNRVIKLLRSSNAAIFLEPNLYFHEIIRTRLMPQFIELNINSTFSRDAKYEVLLSAALEHNCVSLLRDCAKSWIDGSFMGNFSASTGLSLSTLTDWIWKRATCIKSRCNDLCKNLFEFGGYPLDNREQKELAFITRQLKLLSDLLREILVNAKKQIPERVLTNLENKHSSLSMACSYQDILLWLLNIGLLPEASPHNNKGSANNDLIPYPYQELKEFYGNKRLFFSEINETFISKKSGSCRLLFIDSFIEHVCKGNILHEYWLENEGNGLYPPNSLEAMLRVMLVPDLTYENKCAILLYFFLDLNMAIDEDEYKDVVANFIKFPSVFKLSAPLIKTVQAFWNLDHGHYLPAVDEFISPFNKNQCYPQWQVELLIEVLLNHKANNLALRILESQPSLISPLLKLNTLLANELISEAFHFVRSKNDDTLLETFFTCCLCNGRFGIIRDLALSEREGLILQSILKRSQTPGAESLHFVYLLQKSKYLEAVSYMDELSSRAKGIKSSLHQTSQMDTPNLVLSAFNTTMTPVTQGLTDVYFRIKNKIKKKEIDNKSPVPLSCQLIKQNANGLLGGIYHSSALSAHFATYYWGEMEEETKQTKHLLNASNAPFLRRPQIDNNCADYWTKNIISYPQVYKITEKRTLMESGVLDNEHDEFERHKMEHKLNPKKKRRLIGQEIFEDLSHFMKTNKTSDSLKSAEFTFGPAQTSEPEQVRKNSLDLLTRPLVNKSVKQSDGIVTSKPEIHGILKTHTLETGQLQRESLVEEEKNLRFILPATDISTAEVTQHEDAVEDMKVARVVEKSEEDIRKSSFFIDSPKFKQISRAVSEESNKSSISSSNISEENFYSPLSSQNTSKLDCSNLSKYSFLSGPQPRKPLARFSAERSEKSITPEPKTKQTTDSCLINKSTTSPYTTVLESALTSQGSPRCSLERPDFECLKKSASTDEDKATDNEAYITAHASTLISKISPRSSLDRFKTHHSKKTAATDDFASKVSRSEAYVTSCVTFSKPVTSSSNSKEEVTQTSSGFGSIGSPATFAGSKINEFSPQVSSSKVGTTPAKLSECSTVLGSLTAFECTNAVSDIVFGMSDVPLDKTKSNVDKATDEQKRQMLETTLGMTTYEFSMLDSTSVLQQTKSSFELETTKADENENNKLAKEEIPEAEGEENVEENKDTSEQKNIDAIEIQIESNSPEKTLKSNYDCIVLSSSSSSSSQQHEEYDYEDNYSDYERDVNSEIDNEEDNIIDDGNFDFGESNESDIFHEDMEDDSDKVDNNKELSVEESDNSIDTDNEDVIQLIEDSSSDERQNKANYYGESDSSDDVKVIEEEQSPLAAAENFKLKANKETYIRIEVDADDVKKGNVEIITTENLQKGISNSAEITEQLSIPANNSPKIDIRFDENVATEIITENKSEKLKQIDILDTSTDEDKEKTKDRMQTEVDSKSESKDVTSATSEVKPELSNSKKNTEIMQIAEKTKKEIANFSKEDPLDVSEVHVIEQLEIKFTIEKKAAETVEENSQAIVVTESEKVAKQKDLEVKEIASGSSVTSGDLELKEADIQFSIQGEVAEKNVNKAELRVEQKSETNIEIESENIEKKYELEVKEIEDNSAVTPTDLELKAIGIQYNNQEKLLQDKSKLIIKKDQIIKKNENKIELKVEEKTETITETESEKIVKRDELKTVKTPSTSQEKSAEKKSEVIIEKDEVSEKNENEEKPQVINDTEKEEIEVKKIEGGSSATPTDLELKAVETPSAIQDNVAEKQFKLIVQKGKLIEKNENKEQLEVINETVSAEAKETGEIEVKDGSSATPTDLEFKAAKTLSTTQGNVAEKKLKLNIEKDELSKKNEAKVEQEATIMTPQSKRKTLRGSSIDTDLNIVSTPRRNTRGISVPPQTITESEEFSNLTPRSRRGIRASSLQPKYKMEEIETGTPRKVQKTQDTELSETRATRGSSLPPGAVDNKISTRSRSVLLDATIEEPITLDSPSTRTRLRSRLNSMNSELDSPIVGATEHSLQQKRTRRPSISDNTTELPLTPKRIRRDSTTSQAEQTNAAVSTPRTLRGRSVLSVPEDDTESIPASPNPASNKRIGMKRKKSVNEEPATESKEHINEPSPKSDQSAVSEVSYTSSRRLTRTQLAVMEKSVALTQASTKNAMAKEAITPPPSNKRITKSRVMHSSNADSDDAESVSSKLSTASSVTGTKRRVTRSSIKEKDDVDDDIVSVASSYGSEKHQRTRRLKDKSSPNTTLTTIPEDVPIEAKKRGRQTKH